MFVEVIPYLSPILLQDDVKLSYTFQMFFPAQVFVEPYENKVWEGSCWREGKPC